MKMLLKLAVLGLVATGMLGVGFLSGSAFGFKRGAGSELLSAALFVTMIQDKLDHGDPQAASEVSRKALDIYADTLRSHQSLGIREGAGLILAPFTTDKISQETLPQFSELYRTDPPRVSDNAIAFFGYELVGEAPPAHLIYEARAETPSGGESSQRPTIEALPVTAPGDTPLPPGITRE